MSEDPTYTVNTPSLPPSVGKPQGLTISITELSRARGVSRTAIYRAISGKKLATWKERYEAVTDEPSVIKWLGLTVATPIFDVAHFRHYHREFTAKAFAHYVRPYVARHTPTVAELQNKFDACVLRLIAQWLQDPTRNPDEIEQMVNEIYAEAFNVE